MKKKAVSKYYITLTADKVDVVEINSRIFSFVSVQNKHPSKLDAKTNSFGARLKETQARKQRVESLIELATMALITNVSLNLFRLIKSKRKWSTAGPPVKA